MPVDVLAQKRVEAMTRLADEMAKNPNSVESSVAFDEFGNLDFDPAAHPEEARTILEIYDTRIKGKYKGEFAQQVQGALELYRRRVKGK